MSALSLEYRALGAPASETASPIARSLAGVGDLFANSVAAMVLIVGALLPWLVLLGVGFLAVRSIRRRRGSGEAAESADTVTGRPTAGSSQR